MRFLNRVTDFIYSQLERQTFHSDDELYLFMILYVANSFALMVHLGLLVICLAGGVWIMACVNTGSMLVYALCYRWIHARRYTRAGLAIAAEVSCYTLVTVLYMGTATHIVSYLYVVLLMQLIIPYTRVRNRAVVVAFMWAGVIGCVLAERYYQPINPAVAGQLVFSLYNLNVLFLGAIAELMVGNLINNVIAGYNQARLRQFEQEAHTDPMTGLYNRRYAELFFHEMKNSENPAKWCVAMLDVDDFKQVNDRCGHAAGDEVLAAVARGIRHGLRSSDMVFRWGGEEFLILLENADLIHGGVVLEKLRRSIELMEITARNTALGVTVTIGAAELDTGCIHECIEAVDRKMYEGKRSGKNRLVV